MEALLVVLAPAEAILNDGEVEAASGGDNSSSAEDFDADEIEAAAAYFRLSELVSSLSLGLAAAAASSFSADPSTLDSMPIRRAFLNPTTASVSRTDGFFLRNKAANRDDFRLPLAPSAEGQNEPDELEETETESA